MTAKALEVTTFVLPDPSLEQEQSVGPQQVNSSISYHLPSFSSIQTLSNNLGVDSPDTIQGFLYVPSLPSYDPCFNSSQQYVPHNVTRRANVPSMQYDLIAIAPWYSIACTKSYLTSTSAVRAILFYQVNDTSTSIPPPISNAEWTLDDGGRWKSEIDFPAYALPGGLGKTLMQQLSRYSGNITTAPNGRELEAKFPPSSAARLYTDVSVDSGPSLPSLWVFLIIVLGILIAIITASSVFMGLVQRRRRRALRRRVERGEVDLEALGIKRMNVPQSLLDKMPLYTYINREAPETKPQSPDETKAAGKDKIGSNEGDSNTLDTEASHIDPHTPTPFNIPQQQFSQTTCAICLDDFVSNSSQVRELPCHHIFHPECVDVFLRDHSSACPVCKKSTLPDGFCPDQITNAMVRREQLIRRLQRRRVGRRSTTLSAVDTNTRSRNTLGTLSGRVAQMQSDLRAGIHHRWEAGPPTPTEETNDPLARQQVEMSDLSTNNNEPPNEFPRAPAPAANDASVSQIQRQSILAFRSEPNAERRRELARQRAIANLSQQEAAVEDDIHQEERRLPFWRRAVSKVFPALTA